VKFFDISAYFESKCPDMCVLKNFLVETEAYSL
jgi:phage FluMu protein Com